MFLQEKETANQKWIQYVALCYCYSDWSFDVRNDPIGMEYEDVQNRRLGALERKGMENHLINKKVQLKTDNNFMVKSTSEKYFDYFLK